MKKKTTVYPGRKYNKYYELGGFAISVESVMPLDKR
jgi:hypothetical protein